ncbi:mannonate dehydratase [Proteiniclasticum sp. SCR006]|uniref:Mannonate dehydratase n=1 Tax=Proteiniclasticum aestuarii TaxID=2817862 RepID=A0A939KJM8_9CLOT|nr:mannonate dehydratase [Proteiniclasticum aestuarii]MBO1265201.1 mannonate dehydratase [Proteiniclasticum aestuarii]
MQMTWRWYGKDNDDITLDHIRQIPGVTGIVWSLHDKVAGEVWEEARIKETMDYIRSKGFNGDVVESVNIHDDIKLGNENRDHYIDIYIDTIRKLGREGVKVICYNFMPVFDWTRTDLYKEAEDGSNALFYEKKLVDGINPREVADRILKGAAGKTMPGWEPERLAKLEELFDKYKDIDEEKLYENLQYFLERIIPVCEEEDVKMAIHPDDPPWPIFGLPRIIRSREHIRKFLSLVDSPYNGLTLCTGSLGSSADNDLPSIIREFSDRIHFAHIRNVKIFENGDFIETSHRAQDGNVDIVEVLKAYHEAGFEGYVRPDHGRHLWGEEKTCRPGYGLYDRALGVMYMWGVWDLLEKQKAEKAE